MTFTSPRATLEELLEFANKVREAGGGNPLDALMPAVPADASQCLIAKNLNFNCEVDKPFAGGDWAMNFHSDRETRDAVAEALGLEPRTTPDLPENMSPPQRAQYEDEDFSYYVMLPDEIGQVAEEFDEWAELEGELEGLGVDITSSSDVSYGLRQLESSLGTDTVAELAKRLTDFAPYVEEAYAEAYKLATIINEDGSIVL